MQQATQQMEASQRIIDSQKAKTQQLETAKKAAETKLQQALTVYQSAKQEFDNANSQFLENAALIGGEQAKVNALKSAIESAKQAEAQTK